MGGTGIGIGRNKLKNAASLVKEKKITYKKTTKGRKPSLND